MLEFFNPAGLDMLEDKGGAVAYGFIAPRVLYARLVGSLSGDLGADYVRRVEGLLAQAKKLAYFADCSALNGYDCAARTRFLRSVQAHRDQFTSLVMLTWPGGLTPSARAFADAVGEPVAILTDPVEFDRLLSNVAAVPRRPPKQWDGVLPLHSPST